MRCEKESLYAMFPKVGKEEIDEIWTTIKKENPGEMEAPTISVNCS